MSSIDLEKLRAGDEAEFKAFFSFFYPKLLALACRFLDKHIAVDLVQDVFTLYWEQKATIYAVNIHSYLFKTLQNKCLNVLKHQTVIGKHEAAVQIAEARVAFLDSHIQHNDTWSLLVEKDIKSAVESSLTKLPQRCAEAFRLSFFHDLPHKAIAEIMYISHRTVEAHIRQAVVFLRTDLRHLLILILILL